MPLVNGITCPSCSHILPLPTENIYRIYTCTACGHSFVGGYEHYEEQAAGTNNPGLGDFDQQVLNRMAHYGKLDAVKFVKESKNWGLKECVAFVEQLAAQKQAAATTTSGHNPDPMNTLDEKLSALITQKGKLYAIQLCKKTTGWYLKTSKEYVDQLTLKRGLKAKEGCFIATACYGNYDAPEVRILRHYRDTVLQQYTAGRLLIRCYYAVSPPLARRINGSEKTKQFIRHYLLRFLIKRIQRKKI